MVSIERTNLAMPYMCFGCGRSVSQSMSPSGRAMKPSAEVAIWTMIFRRGMGLESPMEELMSIRARFVVAVLLALALVGGWVSAQVLPQPLDTPVVLSGNDVGFRIEARRGGTAVGHIVVRVDGRWIDAELPPFAPSKLGTR